MFSRPAKTQPPWAAVCNGLAGGLYRALNHVERLRGVDDADTRAQAATASEEVDDIVRALLVQFRRVDALRRSLLDVRLEATWDNVVPEIKSAITKYGLADAEDDHVYAWLGTELGHEMNARVFLCDARGRCASRLREATPTRRRDVRARSCR